VADERAERLRVIVEVLGAEQTMTPSEVVALGYVPPGAASACGPVEGDVLGLAFTCTELGRELREREWRALGDFLELYSATDARSSARGVVLSVPRLDRVGALRLAAASWVLGWGDAAAYEDGESFFRDNDERAATDG
jgi:hypothetical protein